MSISIEPRVKQLIAIADGAAWLTAPDDTAITEALGKVDLVGTKIDLVAGLKSTIELANRVIRTIEQTEPVK